MARSRSREAGFDETVGASPERARRGQECLRGVGQAEEIQRRPLLASLDQGLGR